VGCAAPRQPTGGEDQTVQMTRRSFLKRSAVVGAALVLPELVLPERKYWQGVTLAQTRAINMATKEEATITILGPASPLEYTGLYTDPPMVSRKAYNLRGQGVMTEPYDIIRIDQEYMMVTGFNEQGIPLVARNIGGQFGESIPLYGPKVRR
jgi:hypothetical protein